MNQTYSDYGHGFRVTFFSLCSLATKPYVRCSDCCLYRRLALLASSTILFLGPRAASWSPLYGGLSDRLVGR
jgi:hypothetical protein